jgi:hypothetical protein
MKSVSKSIRHIFSEYKSLYIGLGILYLILVLNVVPKIVKEYENTQTDISNSKIDLAYFSVTLVAYILIAILYLVLSYVSGDHKHKSHGHKRI